MSPSSVFRNTFQTTTSNKFPKRESLVCWNISLVLGRCIFAAYYGFEFSFQASQQLFEFLILKDCFSYMSLFNSNTVRLVRLLIAYLLSHLRFVIAWSTARRLPLGIPAADWVLIYLYIGITLSGYKVPYGKHFFKME